MATYGKITIVERPNIPAIFLGECEIIVNIGETKSITKDDLMNTIPPYLHLVQNPTPEIGSIRITGWISSDYRNFLAQTNSALHTYGVLTNKGNRIYKNTSNVLVNNVIPKIDMWAGDFKVQGIKIGSGIIKYRATAFDTTNSNESDYSTVEGKIKITVIDPNNLPPNNIDDGEIDCVINNSVILDYTFFTTNYSDPENDAPNKVRIDSLPPSNKGKLLYNGTEVSSSMLPLEVDANQLDSGVLVYSCANSSVTIGEIIQFQFAISDMGSGQFTS